MMAAVGSTLRSRPVKAVLARLCALSAAEDPPARQAVQAREAELGSKIYGDERAQLYGNAPLSISPEVGELLYVLAAARGARRIVEFGASHGFSTIYLAAALHDMGAGPLITTELRPEKAQLARDNLVDAGLVDLVELRVGDALQTLRGLSDQVDLVFLDGSNDLYLAVLDLVEGCLAPGALVVADLSKDDPHHLRYREYVHDPDHGYISIDIPLDDGVVVSVRMPGRLPGTGQSSEEILSNAWSRVAARELAVNDSPFDSAWHFAVGAQWALGCAGLLTDDQIQRWETNGRKEAERLRGAPGSG
jgi:predicted O-methyltransferase YrrM